jgi:hypothetical protein
MGIPQALRLRNRFRLTPLRVSRILDPTVNVGEGAADSDCPTTSSLFTPTIERAGRDPDFTVPLSLPFRPIVPFSLCIVLLPIVLDMVKAWTSTLLAVVLRPRDAAEKTVVVADVGGSSGAWCAVGTAGVFAPTTFFSVALAFSTSTAIATGGFDFVFVLLDLLRHANLALVGVEGSSPTGETGAEAEIGSPSERACTAGKGIGGVNLGSLVSRSGKVIPRLG